MADTFHTCTLFIVNVLAMKSTATHQIQKRFENLKI